VLTIVLGAMFTCVQALEYSRAGFAYGGNIYARRSSWRPASTASTCSSHDLPDRLLIRASADQFTPRITGLDSRLVWHSSTWSALPLCVNLRLGSWASSRLTDGRSHWIARARR